MGEGNKHHRSAPPRRFRGTRRRVDGDFCSGRDRPVVWALWSRRSVAVKHGISSTHMLRM